MRLGRCRMCRVRVQRRRGRLGAKMSSNSYTAPDGTKFETHWVENIKTGERVEFKTKFPESPNYTLGKPNN